MEAKKRKKNQEKIFFNTRHRVVMTAGISAAIFLLVAILMYVESRDGRLIINNNTDLNLEYVKGKFVTSGGDLSNDTEIKEIKANSTGKKSIDPENLYNTNANYQISFKFEGHDALLIDAGNFNDTFEGSIRLSLTKTNDPNLIKAKITAENGLMPSKLIDCNETYTIDLQKGQVIE